MTRFTEIHEGERGKEKREQGPLLWYHRRELAGRGKQTEHRLVSITKAG